MLLLIVEFVKNINRIKLTELLISEVHDIKILDKGK
jgi:hypothetical protein